MIEYRRLYNDDINRNLFLNFVRHQVVVKCWRRNGDIWEIKDDPFIDDWSENDYNELIAELKNIIKDNGFVYGAFINGKLKGFASASALLFGKNNEYIDLTNLHVSEDVRRNGIGKALFNAVKKWSKSKGAEKLYISSHSAVESQSFYRDLGCVDAKEYSLKHINAEPFDCQLEYLL